jgi:hypothetical protein
VCNARLLAPSLQNRHLGLLPRGELRAKGIATSIDSIRSPGKADAIGRKESTRGSFSLGGNPLLSVTLFAASVRRLVVGSVNVMTLRTPGREDDWVGRGCGDMRKKHGHGEGCNLQNARFVGVWGKCV